MKIRKSGILIFLQICFLTFISCQSQDHEHSAETAEHQTELTTEQRLENVKSGLKLVKAELTQSGDYDCCIQPGCDWCVLHEGECECHDNIKAGKEVCPGCGLGWHNGKGVVQGVDAKEVKWNIVHEHGAREHGKEDHSEDEQKEGGHKH